MTGDRTNRPWLEIRSEQAAGSGVAADASAVWTAYLDGRRCRRDKQFFDAIAETLQFPEYFGHNWDAFDECFRDLFDITEGGMGHEYGGTEGRPEHVLHLVVHHAEDLLVDADPQDLGIVLENGRHPFHRYDPPQPWRRWAQFRATFVCAPAALESFTDRVHRAGLQAGDLRT